MRTVSVLPVEVGRDQGGRQNARLLLLDAVDLELGTRPTVLRALEVGRQMPSEIVS